MIMSFVIISLKKHLSNKTYQSTRRDYVITIQTSLSIASKYPTHAIFSYNKMFQKFDQWWRQGVTDEGAAFSDGGLRQQGLKAGMGWTFWGGAGSPSTLD